MGKTVTIEANVLEQFKAELEEDEDKKIPATHKFQLQMKYGLASSQLTFEEMEALDAD